MDDPVLASDGFTFERNEIERQVILTFGKKQGANQF